MSLWDKRRVRQRIHALLDQIERQEAQGHPHEAGHGGMAVPACIAVMDLLERIASGTFYGKLLFAVRGLCVLRSEVLNQTEIPQEKYHEYLA